jgi:protein-S-isoprenylcysteine O-methyltransferase Ste14
LAPLLWLVFTRLVAPRANVLRAYHDFSKRNEREGAMKNTRFFLSAAVLTVAIVGQIILSFLLFNDAGNSAARNIGWVTLWISALFGWLPIPTMRKWGEVPKGQSYMQTTALVDRGVFAIVRHPQYLAGMLLGVAMPLIAQHWAVAALGPVVVLISYRDTFEEEKSCLEKFGAQYEAYRQRVPRVNFITGSVRLIAAKLSA